MKTIHTNGIELNLTKSFILDGEKLEERINFFKQELDNELRKENPKTGMEICLRTVLDEYEELKNHLTPALEVVKPLVVDSFNDGTKTRYFKRAEQLGITTLPNGVNTGEQYFTEKFGK